MKALRGILQKMSSRERWLVLGLVGGLLISAAGVYFLIMLTSISEMEDLIADGREGFRGIERTLPQYLALKQKNEALMERIRKNPVRSLRLPVNAIAKTVTATSEESTISRRMSDVVRFSGKTRETPLIKTDRKGKKKKRKKATGADKEYQNLYWMEEEMDFPAVSVDSMFQFLTRVHESEDLLFINALELTRKSNDPNEVRMSLTMGTIQYIEPAEEED